MHWVKLTVGETNSKFHTSKLPRSITPKIQKAGFGTFLCNRIDRKQDDHELEEIHDFVLYSNPLLDSQYLSLLLQLFTPFWHAFRQFFSI